MTMEPNGPTAITRSRRVGLHAMDDGSVWLVQEKHWEPGVWFTVRLATYADKSAFENAPIGGFLVVIGG